MPDHCPSQATPDIAVDWVGPLETVHTDTKGRGAQATRSIQAGEVLLVQRPLLSMKHNASTANSLVTEIATVRYEVYHEYINFQLL